MTGFEYGDGPSSMTGVAAQVNGTRTWARVLSVMNYIAAAFTVCAGLLLSVAGSAIPQMGSSGKFIGIVYILLAAIYVYPAMQLGRVATLSGSFNASTSLTDLEAFLRATRRTFKFYALLMIIGLVLGVVFVVAAIALGGAAALAGRS